MSELIDWLQQEERRLTDWGRRAENPVGFGYLNDVGEQINDHERSLLITARMTYVFSLAVLRGDESARTYAAHGINALSAFWDPEHGGWFSRIEPGSHVETDKSAYDHAFVLLASAAATIAGVDGADDVLRRAIEVIENRFWSETDRALVDSFSADWATAEKYRGGNANMHFVEACLVAAFATGDDVWLDRALSIADRIINVSARDNAWRIAEHFDEHWQRLLEYNHDRPADQFRPYGYLVGHSFEWARLLLHLDSALRSRGRTEPWLREAAVGLWNASITAWNIDGHPGFVYTQDWNDNPVIDLRLHWVICEAVAAAWALSAVTGDEEYAAWFCRFWQYIREQFVDEEYGSWHHELSPAGEPSAVIWPGKPDVYHAYNAVILPLGTFTPSAVQSAAEA